MMLSTDHTHGLTKAYWPADRSEPVLDQTIGEALREAASRYGSRTALIDGTLEQNRRQWSFDDLLENAERTARALLTHFTPGEQVAVWAANSPEWVFLEFGAALAGVTLVTVNPAYLGKEAAHVLGQSKASGVVVQPVYRGRDLVQVIEQMRPELPHLRHVISLGDWDAFLASAEPTTPLPRVRPGDTAQIQYTSGTTGFPKGAQLTHRGLANNGRLYARVIGAGSGDVWVNPMPMFHTAGCGLVTMGALQTGGVHVLPHAFDPALMLALVEAERGTVMLSVPTMLIRMLDHPDAATRNLSSWRLTTLGAPQCRPSWCDGHRRHSDSRSPSASARPRLHPTSPTRYPTILIPIGWPPSAGRCRAPKSRWSILSPTRRFPWMRSAKSARAESA